MTPRSTEYPGVGKPLTSWPRIRANVGCFGSYILALMFWSLAFAHQPGLARAGENPATVAKPDFNRDIRPILSENCYKCHGPDDGARKSNLRFDIRSEPLKPTKSGQIPIVPSAPEKSELVRRITSKDPDKHMPPVQSGKKLSPSQIDTLRK